MRTLSVSTDSIEIGERHRSLNEDACARLMASMKEIGLKQPISIRIVDLMVIDGQEVEGAPVLVAGRHRLEAARRLGWSHIECFEVDDDALQAELWEIDENLIRAELSAAQWAEHLARRKEIWGLINASGTNCPTKRKFASETAERTGGTKKDINRHIARAEKLGPDIRLVAGTSLDKGVELDALAKMSAEERAPIIARAVAGEHVRARRPQKAAGKQLEALKRAWREASPEARQMFLDSIRKEAA